jgi:hypothetical protein
LMTSAMALLLAACSPQSCPPACVSDSCAGGDNFANLRLDPANPPEESQSRLDVLFDPGVGVPAPLPDSYYAAALPKDHQSTDGGSIVTQVTLVSTGHFRFDLERPLGQSVSLRLLLPDRRGFISCRHAGMDDRYTLDLQVTKGSLDAGYSLGGSQSVDLGPI